MPARRRRCARLRAVKLEDVGDPGDARLADYGATRDPKRLRERGAFLVEGRELVRTLIRADRFRVRSVIGTARGLESLGGDLARLAGPTPVYRVGPDVMASAAGHRFHQGCAASGERAGAAPSARSLIEAMSEGRRRVLVLEGVTDPDNVGGIFRSALAFGADAVLLGPRCAAPLYRKASRTSLGATLRVPFAELPGWPEELGWLRAAGFAVLGLAPRGGVDLTSLDPDLERVALLLGTEGYGLSAAARAAADRLVRIPMVAGVDSLNVSAAAAIGLHRFFRGDP